MLVVQVQQTEIIANFSEFKETEMEIEDEVDILMSSDILAAQMSTKSITFTRAQTGWIFREDKKVSLFYLNTVFLIQ